MNHLWNIKTSLYETLSLFDFFFSIKIIREIWAHRVLICDLIRSNPTLYEIPGVIFVLDMFLTNVRNTWNRKTGYFRVFIMKYPKKYQTLLRKSTKKNICFLMLDQTITKIKFFTSFSIYFCLERKENWEKNVPYHNLESKIGVKNQVETLKTLVKLILRKTQSNCTWVFI